MPSRTARQVWRLMRTVDKMSANPQVMSPEWWAQATAVLRDSQIEVFEYPSKNPGVYGNRGASPKQIAFWQAFFEHQHQIYAASGANQSGKTECVALAFCKWIRDRAKPGDVYWVVARTHETMRDIPHKSLWKFLPRKMFPENVEYSAKLGFGMIPTLELSLDAERRSRVEVHFRCLGPDTLIESPDGPARRVADIRGKHRVWAWDGEKRVAVMADEPFIKGTDYRYRVHLSDGSWFDCAAGHRVLAGDRSWRSVASLLPTFCVASPVSTCGPTVCGASSGGVPRSSVFQACLVGPAESSLGFQVSDASPFVDGCGGPHVRSWSLVGGWTDRYWTGSRRYGGQFHGWQGSDPAFSPSPADARTRRVVRAGRSGGPGPAPTRSRCGQHSGHSASCGCEDHGEGRVESHSGFPTGEPWCGSSPGGDRLRAGSGQGQEACAEGSVRQYETFDARPLGIALLSPDNTTKQIVRVDRLGKSDIYDFHVPIYNNYVTCGACHHNTEESDLTSFESARLNGLWWTECTREAIFDAIQPRTVARGGFIMMDYVPMEAWHKTRIQAPNKNIFHLRFAMRDNAHNLSYGAVERMKENLTAEQYAIRVEGKDGASQGAVFKEFTKELHVVPAEPLPGDWPAWVYIDPGKYTAALLCTCAPDGRQIVWDEVYEMGLTVQENAAKIKAMLAKHGRDPSGVAEYRIDPAGYQFTAANQATVAQQYTEQGLPVSPWTRTATVGEPAMLDRARQEFMQRRLFISSLCEHLVVELETWRHKVDRDGRVDPAERYQGPNHAIDCLKAWVWTRPTYSQPTLAIVDAPEE